jgi:hypothetical protein
VLRDMFDWDLQNVKVRPIEFALSLLSSLFPDKNIEKLAEEMSNQILDQIDSHVQKFTHFPRSRLNKKEEETIQSLGVCITCESILTRENPDFCF